jgi:hypothetical protein
VSLACNPIDFSGLTLYAGTVNTGTFSWVVAGPVSDPPNLNLGNIEIAGANVTVTSPGLQVANVTFAAANDALKAPAGILAVTGNWNDSVGAGFNANGGWVIFFGAGTQLINSGGQSFNNLAIAPGSTLVLQSDVIVVGYFLNFGTLVANGHQILK